MKLLIVGFNARPIAKAAAQANYQIGIIDYFGDMDLLQLTRNCFAVLRQKAGETLHRPLHRTPAEYLFLLAETMIEEQGDFDGILIGSGFDKYPEIITKVHALGVKVYANTAEKFALCRMKKKMNELAQKAGFAIPKLLKANSISEALEIMKTVRFPIVTRTNGGGGGAGIRKWDTKSELENYLHSREELEEQTLFFQEYIQGINASATVVCSKEKTAILSLNKQLIGDKQLGAPGDFAYCGNIVPLERAMHLPAKQKEFFADLMTKIKSLFLQLKLTGINGVDFVIRGTKSYFMEVNPRFLGSLECTQIATKQNLVKIHLDAFHDTLSVKEPPHYYRVGVKGILFSNIEKPFPVKKYPTSKWIVDRTHVGVILERGDPFCSIVLPAISATNGLEKVHTLAKRIQRLNAPRV
ncbi:MAG: ATP-grasp domain-containing protein [Candidatus Heimdallarchaeota archaeon]|nr:ATP-grasp domain-containing protein [Candidatus Heimdallarchaeota archaeon]